MTEHRLHPFAALRVLRKTLVLYLVPLLRVLFERNWAALRAALRQDLILFLLVCALSWVILHASSWSLDESGTFCLHWKLLFRFDRTVRGASLAALTIERPFYYRLAETAHPDPLPPPGRCAASGRPAAPHRGPQPAPAQRRRAGCAGAAGGQQPFHAGALSAGHPADAAGPGPL